MAKLLHIFYHKEGTFSLLCQQVQLITVSRSFDLPLLYTNLFVKFGLISLEKITGIYFVLNIVKNRIISVGNNSLRKFFELL